MEETPTMTVTAAQAVAAYGVVSRLIGCTFEDIEDIFAVQRAFAVLSKNAEVSALDETRQKLIQKHGTKTDVGIQVMSDKLYDFAVDYEKVSGHSITLPAIKLTRSVLSAAAKAKLLTPLDIGNIEPFIAK